MNRSLKISQVASAHLGWGGGGGQAGLGQWFNTHWGQYFVTVIFVFNIGIIAILV